MPAEMALGVITMAAKPRARSTDLDDHRTITVCTLLDKIYSTCLARRFNEWGEEHNLRADSQTGFRKDHRTADNVLVMRALIDRYRHEKKPLYVAFVDFKKAYDTVPRQLLWAKLAQRGVPTEMLDALRAQYADVPISVKTAYGLTQPFLLAKGLKQGEPTSCDLFGFYVDDLPAAVTSLGAAAALPELGGVPIAPPLHADDLALVSETEEGLQAQLDRLAVYADEWRLEVSLTKTKTMTLSRHGAAAVLRAKYKGQRVPQVNEFVYLGVLISHGGDLDAAAAGARLAVARGAWAAVRRKAAALGITSGKLLFRLFDSVVRPTLESGVEIWGAGFAGAAAGVDGFQPAEVFHRDTIKHMLGVNGSVANVVALAEVGRYPLKCFWARAVYSYWRRVVSLPDSRVALGAAVRDNIELAAAGAACWAKNVLQLGVSVGVPMIVGGNGVATVPPRLVEVAMRQQYMGVYRAAAGTKVQFYKDVVRGGDTSTKTYEMQPYMRRVLVTKRRAALAKLRVSAHRLGVEVARWGHGGSGSGDGGRSDGASTSRAAAAEVATGDCRLCGGATEDEEHMVFHCSHAAIQSVRGDYPDLFATPYTSLFDFLQQSPSQVAAFTLACFQAGQYDTLPPYSTS
jgi:hypothetical protein